MDFVLVRAKMSAPPMMPEQVRQNYEMFWELNLVKRLIEFCDDTPATRKLWDLQSRPIVSKSG